MAKKNLASLMSGIMGQPEQQEIEPNISESLNAPTDKPERRKPGRPKNTQNEIRATFIVSPELLKKVKYISLMDDCLQKDVIDKALRNYINEWEHKNRKINI